MSSTPIYVGMSGANGVTNSNPLKGAIGVAVNGVAVYSNVDKEK